MDNSSAIVLSSQLALQQQMDVLSNNIANLSTPAFKAEEIDFASYLNGSGDDTTAYAQSTGTSRDLREGPLTKTGNPLDVAIQGSGYLSVTTPTGTQYTRNGELQLDDQNELITTSGYQVLNATGQPIVIPNGAGAVSIAQDGTISAGSNQVGKIGLVDFTRPQAMTETSGGLLTTKEPAQPATNGKIIQGMVEESNVQAIVQMTRLLAASGVADYTKSYVNSQASLTQNAIQDLGKTV